jgi:hypothetical protein
LVVERPVQRNERHLWLAAAACIDETWRKMFRSVIESLNMPNFKGPLKEDLPRKPCSPSAAAAPLLIQLI